MRVMLCANVGFKEVKELDTDGEIFRNRANDAEKLIDLAINFILEKGLYNEYMKWKEQHNVKKY